MTRYSSNHTLYFLEKNLAWPQEQIEKLTKTLNFPFSVIDFPFVAILLRDLKGYSTQRLCLPLRLSNSTFSNSVPSLLTNFQMLCDTHLLTCGTLYMAILQVANRGTIPPMFEGCSSVKKVGWPRFQLIFLLKSGTAQLFCRPPCLRKAFRG